MMACTPVVTTPIGAEGLDLVQGERADRGGRRRPGGGHHPHAHRRSPVERLARQGAEYVDAPPARRPGAALPRDRRRRHGRFGPGWRRVERRPRGDTREVLVERIRTIATPGDVVLVPVNGRPGRARPHAGGRGPSPGATARPAAIPPTAPRPSPIWRPSGGGVPGGSRCRPRRRAGATATRSCWTTSRRATGGCTTTSTSRCTSSTAATGTGSWRHRPPHVHVLGTYEAGRTGPSPTLLAGLEGAGELTVTQAWRSSASRPGRSPPTHRTPTTSCWSTTGPCCRGGSWPTS